MEIMENSIETAINISNKIYSTNRDALLEFVTDLKEILCNIKNERTFKKMENVIVNLNKFINEYKKKVNLLQKTLNDLTNKKKPKQKDIEKYNYGKYIGEMKDGEREGKGMYFFKDGDVYDGEWKNGDMHGKGIYYYVNGEVYEGEWKNGKMEGKGIYYYLNGDIYDGYFYNNSRQGKGVYYYIDGSRYEGDWKKGRRHGEGIKYYIDGDRKMGNYINGEPKGKHVTLTKSGNVYTDDF